MYAIILSSLLTALQCQRGDAFAKSIFKAGDPKPSCTYSEPSACMWINKASLGEQIPPGCLGNKVILDVAEGTFRLPFERTYLALKDLLGANKTPCGFCSQKLSCPTEKCPGQPIYPIPPFRALLNNRAEDRLVKKGNVMGLKSESCGGGLACLIQNAPWAYNCNVWPPPPEVLGMGEETNDYLNLVKMRPIHCMMRNRTNLAPQCFCCCEPFHPDPCTGQCELEKRFPKNKVRIFPDWNIMENYCRYDDAAKLEEQTP